jgi:hypothetical protein
MPLVIDNPAAEAQLHAFATSRGLQPDEAIIEALSALHYDETDEIAAAVDEALAEDPADSMSLEDFAAERKRLREERNQKAKAA